jgi:hypothetical protein
MEADPDWWKGHWYRGQALMKMLKGKPQSTAMGERCEQVIERKEGVMAKREEKKGEVWGWNLLTLLSSR